MSAGGSRQGAGGLQAPSAGTGQTGPQAAASAGPAGRRRAPAAARRSRAWTGSGQADVQQTQKASARGDGPEKRAAGLCSWLTPSLRGWRGVSTPTLPGEGGGVPCLLHWRPDTAGEQAAVSCQAARAPAMAWRATKGAWGTWCDHVDLRPTARN